jgi:acetolactate synthase regulatory subunit
MGAGGHLANAAPQLLGADKMEEGMDGIRLFSVPQKDGTFVVSNYKRWDNATRTAWGTFGVYCQEDARLSRHLLLDPGMALPQKEWRYEELTDRMNQRGWPVDLTAVHLMNEQYQENLVDTVATFHARYGPLNFRSPVQLKKFCHERGVRVTSLDEMHVVKYLKAVRKKVDLLAAMPAPTAAVIDQMNKLVEVEDMLVVKQQLGGSSLSKLQTIIDMTQADGRLRNQYMHVGAGQTYRTSGRGVQMQNLKKLNQAKDLDTLTTERWNNDELARNLRQVFTASHTDGQLIIGDLSSIESRGLALLAGARWKLDSYGRKLDMYKVLASKMLDKPYMDVTSADRTLGKVGELSCGYGAGGKAVHDFAEKMGVDLEPEEAAQIVTDWRVTNPEVVDMWAALDNGLHAWVDNPHRTHTTVLNARHSVLVTFGPVPTPQSVTDLYPKARSLGVSVEVDGKGVLSRVFQGVHMRGQDICYLKPSELKSGPQWRAKWTKGGESGFYKLYGGKLTGILTQSFCREIFFQQLDVLEHSLETVPNAEIIGQFHDEIIVDWWPSTAKGAFSQLQTTDLMERVMVEIKPTTDFPMAAEVKTGYRYVK